jgi:phage-related minor tail protein
MANNKIKGLTVEIGGDTTQLGKALESVNKKSNDLSSELGEINRLLKFDPDNAELLAQKQKVLADTITNTAEKLETLREAERQVQRQFERGEVSEEQVRALRREIVATEGKLKSYEEQAKEAEEGTKDLADSADKAGDAGEGMGAKFASAAKVGIGAVVAGATAAVGALVASAEATREYRTEMGKLTTAFETVGHRTEIAEESYKRLYGVIGETDQAVEAAQQIALLAESEEDVVQWSDLAAGVVGRFGDALQPETFFESANETIKLGEATGAYVQLLEGAGYNVEEFNAGLAACTTESEKQAYMLKITDEILGDAADTYRETNAEVIRANDANAAWTATLAEVGASVEPILTDVKMLGTSLLGELLPGITGVTDAFRGLINGEEGSAEAVGAALSGLLTQILDMVVELLPTLATAAMSLLTSLTTTLIEMLPQLVETGITLIMSILEGLTLAIPLITQAIVDMIPRLVEALVTGIPLLIDGAVQLLLALLDAIPLILPPLIEAIPQIVIAIIDGLLSALPELLEGAVQFLLAIVQAIPILLQALLPEVPRIVDTIIDGLLDNLPVLIDGAIELLFGILEAIPEITAAIYEEMPSIVTSIVEALLEAIPELIKAGGQLLEGLVEGMLDFDIKGALKKVGDGVINGFKKAFDIHSPSRVMADIGELLDEGLAVGIEDNAGAPVNALDKLSEDMVDEARGLDGVTLERRMTYTSIPGAQSQADGISSKLDRIYQAILSGQVIMLDGKTLVGSTANRYDTELGQRRVLAERGAL